MTNLSQIFTAGLTQDEVDARIALLAAGGLTPVFISNADSPYTAAAEQAIFCNTSAGAITINLPAGTNEDSIAVSGDATSGTNNITIVPNGAETIDPAGDTSYVIDQAFAQAMLGYEAAGTVWRNSITGTPEVINVEELTDSGIFTPYYQDTSLSNGEGQTYSLQSGRYIKQGKLVNFWIEITATSLGTLTSSAQVYVAGLPFLPNGIAGVSVTYGSGLNLSAAGNSLSGVIGFNTSEYLVRLYEWSATSGPSWLTFSELSATGRLMIQGQYTTDE